MDPQSFGLDPLTLLLAAGAGLLSFVSPCVLPLLPAYLGYMTGLTADELQDQRDVATRAHVLGRSLAFVVGLSLVFTLLGASASVVGRTLLQHQVIILRLAGVLVVILGLHTLGLIRIPLLYREKRLSFGGTDGSYLGALLLGAAFAAGWTPCIGPFLAGLALGTSLRLLSGVRARMQTLELVSGFVLVGMGLLIFSDRLSLVSAWLTGVFGIGLAT